MELGIVEKKVPVEMVKVEDIHKQYGDLEVLKGVSLTANEGEVVTLIGASGSGKSTLLRCLNLLEIPTSGRICVGGEAITMKSSTRGGLEPADKRQVERLRTRVGMVFQNFNLWSHLSVLENVILAPVNVLKMAKNEAIAEAEVYLEKVGLADKRHSYPAYLSGGQQQRVAIARALAMHPKVMLFDEPTSALDPELVGEVLKVIRGLAGEGHTMVMVTHEMAFAREVSSKVIFLHQGRVEESGHPEYLFTSAKSARCMQFVSRLGSAS